MANPNITNVASILGGTTYLTPAVTTSVVLLQNPLSSNTILKINSIVAANVTGTTAVFATVSIYSNGGVAQGSAPSGGTAFPIASTISVPSTASLIITDKTTAFYLVEGTSIAVTSGVASGLTFTVSYDSIS